jgi:hypothetical protein
MWVVEVAVIDVAVVDVVGRLGDRRGGWSTGRSSRWVVDVGGRRGCWSTWQSSTWVVDGAVVDVAVDYVADDVGGR